MWNVFRWTLRAGSWFRRMWGEPVAAVGGPELHGRFTIAEKGDNDVRLRRRHATTRSVCGVFRPAGDRSRPTKRRYRRDGRPLPGVGLQRQAGARWRYRAGSDAFRARNYGAAECMTVTIEFTSHGPRRSIVARNARVNMVRAISRAWPGPRRVSGSRARHAYRLFSRPLARQFLWLLYADVNVAEHRRHFTDRGYRPRTDYSVVAQFCPPQFIIVLMTQFAFVSLLSTELLGRNTRRNSVPFNCDIVSHTARCTKIVQCALTSLLYTEQT